MSKTYNNGIITTAGFQFNANLPLDDRLVVETFEDLSSLLSYDGMIVYVQSEKQHYKSTDGAWSVLITNSSEENENVENITVNESSFIFGDVEKDNLQSTSEHSALFGSNIKAGVRGLKVLSTDINEDTKSISLTVEGYEGKTAEQLYTEEAGYIYAKTRAALILAHHSFESFKVMSFSGNVINLAPINPDMQFISEYYELHKDNTTRNYLWLYNVDNSDEDKLVYDISINDNCPIRPEVDYTYALGNNINVVGRGSFSSGAHNQNMGWYATTLGVDNLAYYAGFALGGGNKALGTYSVAINQNTEATATGATSKGYLTKATANYAEAGGQETEANHKASFTHGLGTKSGRQHQSVFGEYNEESKTALFVVGNGKKNHYENFITTPQTIKVNGSIDEKTLRIVQGGGLGISYYSDCVIKNGKIYGWTDNYSGYGENENYEKIEVECGYVDYAAGEIKIISLPPVNASSGMSIYFDYVDSSNALEVEKDGSATIGKTGSKENSVATKGYVDAEAVELKDYADAVKVDVENNIDKAIDTANVSYLVENYAQIEKCEPNTAHNNITIKDNVITCTSNAIDVRNQYRAQVSNIYADKYQGLNYELKFKIDEFKEDVTHDGLWFKFVDFSGDNIPKGAEGLGLVIRSNNCLFGYITEDSFNYDNTSLGVKTFNISLNTTDEFKLNARLESNKIFVKFTNLTTNVQYGEYEYPLTETCTITPSLAIGFRYVRAKVEYNIYSDKYVSLARKSDVNQALANAKSYTDSKLASGYSIITNNIESECIIEHLDMSNLTGQSYDLGHTNIVPGSVEIIPNSDAPSYDAGNGVLYKIASGRETFLIDYKTGIISNIPKLVLYTDCEIRFKYYIYNDVNSPSTNVLNSFTDNKIENYFSKFNNYIIENNNYIHLEDINAERELYGLVNSEGNEFFELNNKGFINARFTEKENISGISGANPNNTANRYITFTNNYVNAYEDFLMKIDIDLKDIYASQTGIKGATGLIIFPFENAAGIQFRQNGSIVCSYGGTTTVVSNKQINKVGQYTIYFKYMKSLGKLNIYKDSLDNLLTSIQLLDNEISTFKPQLAFGGRCCTYSATCEIHKADFKIKNITKEAYDNLTVKDPYVYYTVDGTSAIEDALDDIIDIQNNLIGGGNV